MNQQELERMQDLERRVGQLTTVAIVQGVALTLALLRYAPIAALCFVVLLPILAFAHHKVPSLARKCGRLFSFLSEPPKTSANSVTGESSPTT